MLVSLIQEFISINSCKRSVIEKHMKKGDADAMYEASQNLSRIAMEEARLALKSSKRRSKLKLLMQD